LVAPFGLCFLAVAFAPGSIGRQDLAGLMARQPAVSAHWRQHIRASGFTTIHAATFNFSRPIGTSVPQPLKLRLASIDPRALALPSWNAAPEAEVPQLQYPAVNRGAKGDRQPVLRPGGGAAVLEAQPSVGPAAVQAPEPPLPVSDAKDTDRIAPVPASVGAEPPTAAPAPAAPDAVTLPEASESGETVSEDMPDPVESIVADALGSLSPEPAEPVIAMARLYFGHRPLGDTPAAIEKWAPGEQPTIVEPAEAADRDLKQSALDPARTRDGEKPGESVAPKGEVTGEGKRPLTPAERLKLNDKARARAEKCLADAVYFESRGEPVRGQIAVAQVVMNRVFSGYYPRNVCATVYQNKHRRLACQFTFACDGIPEVVTEPNAWVRAMRIARDVLDGKLWVPEVNRATHYHAYWVRPSWVREMKRLYKFGVHSFYRPRRWGDGSDAPSWGSATATQAAIAKL
jgi:spore germination cell wall hydrolase CwlJ-like protein